MILADYHLHTSFSSDSESPMEEMIRHAVSLGLKTICFTEHHDIDYPVNPDGFDFLLDLPSYKEEIFKMKEHYQDQIEINYGVELGLMPTTLDQCAAFVKDEPFDFIIGSTHIVDFMDPYDAIYFETYPARLGLAHYFDLLDAILRMIIENGKGIEVNTAGLKYGMSDPNPHHEIIKRYMELGGEIITIGSDGHCPKHMAYDFYKLPEFLSNLGIRYYTVFRDKKPEFIKL